MTHGVRFKTSILPSQVLIGEGLVSCIYSDLDKEYYADHATLEIKLKLNPSILVLVIPCSSGSNPTQNIGLMGLYSVDVSSSYSPFRDSQRYHSRAAVVYLNFRAGSIFPVPVCTVPISMDRTSPRNKVDAVRL